MKLYAKIINNTDFGGLYTEDRIKDDWTTTEVLPDATLIVKKWNGTAWVEGATQAQLDANLDAKLKAVKDMLYDEVLNLETKAKGLCLGKPELSKEQIETQERIYLRKYNIAKDITPDTNGLIALEAQSFGYTFEDYKQLIINKYEAGKAAFDRMQAMIEFARSKVLLNIEAKDLDRSRHLITLMTDVEPDTIEETFNQILQY